MRQSLITQMVLGAALLTGAACTSLTCQAQTESFPTKSIAVIVPHTAGGTSDILARTLAAEASKILKQQIIVENKGCLLYTSDAADE